MFTPPQSGIEPMKFDLFKGHIVILVVLAEDRHVSTVNFSSKSCSCRKESGSS